ncbi:MAG TPA: hypothetical protein VG890_14545 [Puia sp.]|nr:hypothetical protein [Puia sp.]
MASAFVHKTPVIILEKLNRLLSVLQTVKNNYEQTALRIPNIQMRLSLLSLAQASKQYANELMAHIETLGGKSAVQQAADPDRQEPMDNPSEKTDGRSDDIREMNLGEQSLMKTYREILNEPFLYDNIRRMLKYQQNGLLHYFSQLKMLYAALVKTTTKGTFEL